MVAASTYLIQLQMNKQLPKTSWERHWKREEGQRWSPKRAGQHEVQRQRPVRNFAAPEPQRQRYSLKPGLPTKTAVTTTESAADEEGADEEVVGNKPADKLLNVDRGGPILDILQRWEKPQTNDPAEVTTNATDESLYNSPPTRNKRRKYRPEVAKKQSRNNLRKKH